VNYIKVFEHSGINFGIKKHFVQIH